MTNVVLWLEKEGCAVDYCYLKQATHFLGKPKCRNVKKESQTVDHFKGQQFPEDGLSAETPRINRTEIIAHKNRHEQGTISIYLCIRYVLKR